MPIFKSRISRPSTRSTSQLNSIQPPQEPHLQYAGTLLSWSWWSVLMTHISPKNLQSSAERFGEHFNTEVCVIVICLTFTGPLSSCYSPPGGRHIRGSTPSEPQRQGPYAATYWFSHDANKAKRQPGNPGAIQRPLRLHVTMVCMKLPLMNTNYLLHRH